MARVNLLICVFICSALAHTQSILHVRSPRTGCIRVKSEDPCPARLLNTDIAAFDYGVDVEMVADMLAETKAKNASDECISALTTTFCSSVTPRCFFNGSRDYGDATEACRKANATCPEDSLDDGLCASLKTGMQPLSACVKPSNPIRGSCPQPKYKMPENRLDLYIRSSEEYEEVSYFENLTTASYANGTRMFSPECVANITELYCLPFYCSADEQDIVVEYTYEDCEKVYVDCFDRVYAQVSDDKRQEVEVLLDKYYQDCEFYPDADESGFESTPEGSTASSPSPPGVLPTLPSQNKSSISPLENETFTPPKKTILLTASQPSPTASCTRYQYYSTMLFLLLLISVI